jgi:hypothetical protein
MHIFRVREVEKDSIKGSVVGKDTWLTSIVFKCLAQLCSIALIGSIHGFVAFIAYWALIPQRDRPNSFASGTNLNPGK